MINLIHVAYYFTWVVVILVLSPVPIFPYLEDYISMAREYDVKFAYGCFKGRTRAYYFNVL